MTSDGDETARLLMMAMSFQQRQDAILSREILLLIRDYVCCPRSLTNGEFDCFHCDDGQRSWRNFLSSWKGGEHWQTMKKETRFWKLNQYYSKNYLTDNSFRQTLLSLMKFPRLQLSLNLSLSFLTLEESYQERLIIENAFCVDVYKIPKIRYCQFRNVGNVKFINAWLVDSLRVGPDVQSIEIQGGINMDKETLSHDIQVLNCTYLTTRNVFRVNTMSNLISLRMPYFSQCSGYFNEQCFPRLSRLYLHGAEDITTIPPRIELPALSLLVCESVIVQDISQCISLTSLELIVSKIMEGQEIMRQIKSLVVEGLLEIYIPFHFALYSQLRSVTIISEDEILPPPIISDLEQLCRLPLKKLHLSFNWASPQLIDFLMFISIPVTVRDFKFVDNDGNCLPLPLTIPNSNTTTTTSSIQNNGNTNLTGFHRFEKVDLSYTKFSDYSMFRYTRELTLTSCPSLTDLEPLKNIPFLSLSYCDGITDFSPLGRQRYLNLGGCRHLRDEHLIYLSTVFHLDISMCGQLSRLDPLTGNRFLYAHVCMGLKEVRLFGDYYEVLSFRNCSNLKELSFPNEGKVNILEIMNTSLPFSESFQSIASVVRDRYDEI